MMVQKYLFGKAAAFTLLGVEDNHGWLLLLRLGFLYGGVDLLDIGAVYVLSEPVKSGELTGKIAKVADIFRITVQLLLVVVHKGDQVAKVPMAGKQRPFPNLALVTLAVT